MERYNFSQIIVTIVSDSNSIDISEKHITRQKKIIRRFSVQNFLNDVFIVMSSVLFSPILKRQYAFEGIGFCATIYILPVY